MRGSISPMTARVISSWKSKMSVARAFELLRPQVCAGRPLDQLRRDAHFVAGAPNAALQDVADAELAGHVAHIHRAALVGKGRVAGDDGEGPEARQRRDDLLDQPVGEEALLGIAAEILERQHGHGRRARCRSSLCGHASR